MLGSTARQRPFSKAYSLSAWVMPLMPQNMSVEAHCQEDRGINAREMVESENVKKNEDILTLECPFYRERVRMRELNAILYLPISRNL